MGHLAPPDLEQLAVRVLPTPAPAPAPAPSLDTGSLVKPTTLRLVRSHEPSPTTHVQAPRHAYGISYHVDDLEKLQYTVSSPPNLSPKVSEFSSHSAAGGRFSGDTIRGGADEPDDLAIVSQLEPVDRGRGAWTYLVVAFLLEGLCWGFPFSYGVFQAYYSHTEPFAGNKGISVVGTLSTGVPYLASIVMFPIISRYLNQRKNMMWLGLFLCIVACIASSFATQTWHLILSQGALYGLGTVFLYTPSFSLMNEWFVKRRGLAYGVMFAGTGCSGLILPLLFEHFLSKYGHATTLRIWSVVLAVLTSPALYFMKPRLPLSATARHPSAPRGSCKNSTWIDFSFVKSRTFHIFAFANFFQGLGYFLPGIYLPSYALDLSLPPLHSTIVLSIFNLATVFGQIGFGYLSDTYDIYLVMFGSTSVSAAAVYLLWGLSKTFAVLMTFAIIYGLSAGGFSVMWTRFGAVVSGDPNSNGVLTVIGVFSFQRGIGNILSGPISSALVGSTVVRGGAPGDVGYGLRKYESMIVFVGSLMLVSCLGVGGRLIKHTPPVVVGTQR